MNEDRVIKPFSEFLLSQRRGALHEDLSSALNELLSAVVEHNKPGSLNLTIKFVPTGKGYSPTVVVTDAIKVKAPEGSPESALFFVDNDGNLTRRDPNQPELGLREAPRPDTKEESA